MKKITFEEVPAAIVLLLDQVELLNNKIDDLSGNTNSKESDYLDIDGLIKFLPDHPAKATIYGLKNRGQIPFIKRGKRLIFHKPTIIKWLEEGKSMSIGDAKQILLNK